MSWLENIILVSIGHTAAGKTSLLKYLSKEFALSYIEEGQIKRDLLPRAYTSQDSLDENLRDRAYKIAISIAVDCLKNGTNVALDASFHRQYRRNWLFESLENDHDLDPIIIWLYVYCNNQIKIKKRISKRQKSKFNVAENQANQYYIYEHIINTFDKVSIESFPTKYKNIILNIDTDTNEVSFNACNFNLSEAQTIEYQNFYNAIKAYLNQINTKLIVIGYE